MAQFIPGHVHIKTSQALQGLHQSKQVLAALQKFGEVLTFRNLKVSPPNTSQHARRATTKKERRANNLTKYDVTNDNPNPNRPIVAIFESPDAADRAIASSPITLTLPPSPLPTSKLPTAESAKPMTIECTIQPSRHNHEASMKRNPFYSTYNLFKSSPVYDDMMQKETGAPFRELADVLQRPKYHISGAIKHKVQEQNRRLGAHSLMGLWREGMESPVAEEVHPGNSSGHSGYRRGGRKEQVDSGAVE